MANYAALKAKLEELVNRQWDLKTVEARCRSLAANGITRKALVRDEILTHRAQILGRVQRRGEEYNFYAGNCARSAALAAMEEFGLGNMDVVKALAPFPGYGGTGWMCGGLTGGLMAIGLHCGSNDLENHDSVHTAIAAAQIFMARFEEEVGAVTCRKIQEDVVFGRYMDPGASPQNMEVFQESHGFEKCSLIAGIGARLAAEVIIDCIAQEH
jgi:C_GCAxxG_C_C family probable redox protein